MNIILQNYKMLITKIINDTLIKSIEASLKNFNEFSIDNYINLLSSFDNSLCECFKHAFINLINFLDSNYCSSLERKRKYHIKQRCTRTILTIFGEITITRTFYKSKLNGNSFCYIDRLLGLQKYDYFDPYIKAEILDFVSNHNYSETAEHINTLIGNRISLTEKNKYLSRQSVRNIILNSKLAEPEIQKLEDVEDLYIIADEKWIPTQNNKSKKVMQKSIVIFDGFNKIGKRKSLNNKMTFSGRNEDFIYNSINYIEKAYNINKIKHIYLLGDGAVWINNLKYYFNCWDNISIIQGLDHFHFKQSIWRIYNEKDVYDTLLSYIYENNKDDFNRLINEIIDLKPDREEKINEYKNYLLNNWDKINNLITYNLSCPMESQISHTFASYFTSRPKAYNKNTITILINLRLKKKNKYNIKNLYFKNLNKNIIIDLNEKPLNYSIFDTKETYSIILNGKHYY